MPTLSLTVLPAKALKGGNNKVRIAVAHNSQSRYIVTDNIEVVLQLRLTKDKRNQVLYLVFGDNDIEI